MIWVDHYGYHCQGSACVYSSKVSKLSNMADTEEVTVMEPSRPPTTGSIKETTGETTSRPASGENNASRYVMFAVYKRSLDIGNVVIYRFIAFWMTWTTSRRDFYRELCKLSGNRMNQESLNSQNFILFLVKMIEKFRKILTFMLCCLRIRWK